MHDASGVAEQIPLTTLLSWTWTAFAIETDNAVEAAGSERVRRLFRTHVIQDQAADQDVWRWGGQHERPGTR
jgi:hypothetical protein